MKHLKLYEDFLFEQDGYGRDFFVKKKDGKIVRYYFKIEGEQDTLCFVLGIGKTSKKIFIESAENSYGVISVEPIKQSIMDDFLVNGTDYRSRSKDEFELSNNELMRFYRIVFEAIKDYLENNPKVSMIYDEILLNLNMDPQEYFDRIKIFITTWSYDGWSIQEGSVKKTLIYIRRDHE